VSNHHWHGFICVLVCRCRFAARSSCKLAAAALVATLSVAATYRRTASHLAHSTPVIPICGLTQAFRSSSPSRCCRWATSPASSRRTSWSSCRCLLDLPRAQLGPHARLSHAPFTRAFHTRLSNAPFTSAFHTRLSHAPCIWRNDPLRVVAIWSGHSRACPRAAVSHWEAMIANIHETLAGNITHSLKDINLQPDSA